MDRWEEAVPARLEAVDLWHRLGDVRREGDSLRRHGKELNNLSRNDEARAVAHRAIALLEPEGTTPEPGVRPAELAGLDMVCAVNEEAVAMAARAAAIATELGLDDLLSDALNTEACSLLNLGQPWQDKIERALDIALRAGHGPLAARAYNNLYAMLVTELRMAESEACYAAAMTHARDHDIATYRRCMAGARAITLAEMARWQEALTFSDQLLAEKASSDSNRYSPSLARAMSLTRTGDDAAGRTRAELVALAHRVGEAPYLVPALLVETESLWLDDRVDEARLVVEEARQTATDCDPGVRRDVELWAHRVGLPASAAALHDRIGREVLGLELAGRSDEAARLWDSLSRPYDAALALLGSDDEQHLREAFTRLDALGAAPAARKARQRLRELGFAVPNGARATTREHPLGLTRREQEVLDALATGASNDEIAARLVITAKTVDHHVSSILAKLGVANRHQAAREARRLGLVEDGEPAAST